MEITTDYYKLTALPKLFIIEVYLSWDERVAASFTADMSKMAVAQYPSHDYGILMDLRAWALHTPEAESFMDNFAATNDLFQQIYFAMVIDSSVLKRFQLQQMIKDVPNTNLKVFEDISEAESWLGTFGYVR